MATWGGRWWMLSFQADKQQIIKACGEVQVVMCSRMARRPVKQGVSKKSNGRERWVKDRKRCRLETASRAKGQDSTVLRKMAHQWRSWAKKKKSEVAQSCLTLCSPMDCSLPGSSVPGVFQARTLEWVVMPSSRESSQPRGRTQVSCIAGRLFTI